MHSIAERRRCLKRIEEIAGRRARGYGARVYGTGVWCRSDHTRSWASLPPADTTPRQRRQTARLSSSCTVQTTYAVNSTFLFYCRCWCDTKKQQFNRHWDCVVLCGRSPAKSHRPLVTRKPIIKHFLRTSARGGGGCCRPVTRYVVSLV